MKIANTKQIKPSQLAAALGVNKSQPTIWKKLGCPVNADGSFDISLVLEWRVARAVETTKAKLVSGRKQPQNVELAELRSIQGKRAMLKLRREQGEVVDIEIMKKREVQLCTTFRNILWDQQHILPPLLVGSSIEELAAKLRQHASDVLNQLISQIQAAKNQQTKLKIETAKDEKNGI